MKKTAVIGSIVVVIALIILSIAVSIPTLEYQKIVTLKDPQQAAISQTTELPAHQQRFSPVEQVAPLKITTKEPHSAQEQAYYISIVNDYRFRSFHFGADCRTVPTNSTIGTDTRILLDNQSDQHKIITIGENIYKVNAYSFITPRIKLIGKVAIHCDDQKNVAILDIKK